MKEKHTVIINNILRKVNKHQRDIKRLIAVDHGYKGDGDVESVDAFIETLKNDSVVVVHYGDVRGVICDVIPATKHAVGELTTFLRFKGYEECKLTIEPALLVTQENLLQFNGVQA